MKKTFKLDELGCANCGAKMEDAIKKIEGVVSAKVNFMAQKLTIEASDERFDAIDPKAFSENLTAVQDEYIAQAQAQASASPSADPSADPSAQVSAQPETSGTPAPTTES